MDKIVIKGMEFFAHIGYYQEEKTMGNHFKLDLEIQRSLGQAGQSDDLKDTIDYEKAYEIVKSVMEEKANLIESVGSKILDRLGTEFESIQGAVVRVMKTQPPMEGKLNQIYVEMFRQY